MPLELSRAVGDWMSAYVESGRLPCAMTLIAQHGQVVELSWRGMADVEAGVACNRDTLFRIYSMTKPITAAAAMVLVDEGLLDVRAPVKEFVPSFSELTVDRGPDHEPSPATVDMTVHHLLTHTAGLTYGAPDGNAVVRAYLERRTDFEPDDGPLAEVVDRLATIPLLFEPGSRWCYGVSLDVLGRVLEVAAGQSFDEILRTRLFEPLGMVDTSFSVRAKDRDRVASLYTVDGESFRLEQAGADAPGSDRVSTYAGGAGLFSTIHDYARFSQLLLDGGVGPGGVRVLSRRSVDEMTRNHLPGDLSGMGQSVYNETTTAGVGFGYGGSVVIDPGLTSWASAAGEYAWGGYASTAFWIDPMRDLVVVFLTQVTPSRHHPIRAELRRIIADHF